MFPFLVGTWVACLSVLAATIVYYTEPRPRA